MNDSLQAPDTISHYRILSLIGSGGMGEVYLAEDVKLGRRLAVKLLLPQFANDEDRLRRFEQEARAASALNHPNIITIYEIGRERGVRFIAMEYIEGETLRQRLKKGKISEREAVEIAIQVARALVASHQAGIVHRDIKPENVMLRPDGYVKVLDFGIVKLTEKFMEQVTSSNDAPADVKTITLVSTEANIVMGSPNYMSPEQARGLAVDGRTDIFSLGAILYEMVTARIPFDGATFSDILVSLLEREPLALQIISPEVSTRFEQIVERALAKDLAERYQSVQDLLTDLRRLKRRLDFEAGLEDSFSDTTSAESLRLDQDTRPTVREFTTPAIPRKTWSAQFIFKEIKLHSRGFLFFSVVIVLAALALLMWSSRGGGTHAIESIAVLPFVNESNDQNTEYLSDGITESLINNLSQSPRLKVTSRNSAFRFKGRSVTPKAAGDELHVHAVLTGRIEQRGDHLKIKVELVDVRDDTQVWGEQYNRPIADLLTAQEEIARHVVDKLELRLSAPDEKRVSNQGTSNTEAYQLYLRGRYYWNKRTEDGLKKGIEYFNQAIEQDPAYAASYAGLADCYAMLTEYSAQPPTELYPNVKAAARKALEIDDTLAEAHTSLAAAFEYEWSWNEAEKEYRRAIELNSNYATAHQWYAIFLGSRLRNDEAIREMKQALELDPLSLIINTSMGRILYGAREYDKAIEMLKKTVDMDPNFAEARFHLAMAYEGKKRYADAAAEFQKAVELFDDPTMSAWVGREHALAGRRADAERILHQFTEMSRQKYVAPYPLATIYAALGDKERALEMLERVYNEHSYYVVWLNVDPVFDELRSDARFQELLKKIGIGV